MTTKESVSVHRMQRFCEGGVEVGWGRGYFPAGRPGSKIPTPLGILSEKILNFLGAVCARMCARECVAVGERETQNRNSAALIGMWVDAGGGRLHM